MMIKKDPRVHELLDFINKWARDRERNECQSNGRITDYGRGYHQACNDIFDKVETLFKENKSADSEFEKKV